MLHQDVNYEKNHTQMPDPEPIDPPVPPKAD